MRISPLRPHFDAHPVDWNHWQKLYKKHQKEYPRSRLRMVSSAEEMQNLLRHIQEIIEQEYARYTFNSSP